MNQNGILNCSFKFECEIATVTHVESGEVDCGIGNAESHNVIVKNVSFADQWPQSIFAYKKTTIKNDSSINERKCNNQWKI